MKRSLWAAVIFLFLFAVLAFIPGCGSSHRTTKKFLAEDAEAHFQRGRSYYYGQGVPQDYAEALRWYLRAAALGNVPARVALGNMYAEGKGVRRDYEQAYQWWISAAARGDLKAENEALSVLAQMTPEQVAEALPEAASRDPHDIPAMWAATEQEPEITDPPATVLRTLSVERLNTGVAVRVIADGPIFDYKVFTLAGPDRVVYDLYGLKTPFEAEQLIIVDAYPWLWRVRHYGYGDKVRLVLDSFARSLDSFRALPVREGLLIQSGGPAVEMAPKTLRPSRLIIARDGPFIAYQDKTVLDARTGLMWAASDNGSDINWADAADYCRDYRGGGYDDWRMPAYDELAGLYDRNRAHRTTQRPYEVHLTGLIQLSTSWVWTAEARDYEGGALSFHSGTLHMVYRLHERHFRVLPVRSAR